MTIINAVARVEGASTVVNTTWIVNISFTVIFDVPVNLMHTSLYYSKIVNANNKYVKSYISENVVTSANTLFLEKTTILKERKMTKILTRKY